MRRTFPTLLAALVFALPLLVSAQFGTLVPCDGPECQICNVVTLGQKIINFLVGIASFIAVLFFAYAGFQILTARGNSSKITEAWGIFTNVLIGFIILLSGWLIIDTIMKYAFEGKAGEPGSELYEATKSSFGPWNQIKCVLLPTYKGAGAGVSRVGGGGLAPVAGPGAATGGVGASGGCPRTCQPIDTTVVACKNACALDGEYEVRLYAVAQASGIPKLVVTEGYPPSQEHKSGCHSNGTCADVGFSDNNYSLARIQALQAVAAANGLKAVYEPGPGNSCAVGIANCRTGVGSTGNHFHIEKI
jgi:hypothetical protein